MQDYIDQFQQYWAQFSTQLKLEKRHSDQLFNLLFNAYTELQRFYHTVQHIVECLDLFHQIKHHLNDPIAVELTIWFHDAVYDPQASNNEEQSAELMKQYSLGIVTSNQLQKVFDWIIATKAHYASSDQDLNYLLDIDLAILGKHPQRFAEYEQQIQQEYSWVEPDLYHVKRAEVLQHFSQMKPIYQTDFFRKLFEDQAKQNLLTILLKR